MGAVGSFVKAMLLVAKGSSLGRKSERLAVTIQKLSPSDPQRIELIETRNAIESERVAIDEEVRRIHEEIDQEVLSSELEDEYRVQNPDQYTRPGTLLDKRLGPLPRDAKILHPSVTEMRKVESRNGTLILLSVGVFILMTFIDNNAPWLFKSVILWIFPQSEEVPQGLSAFSYHHVIATIALLAIVLLRNKVDQFLFKQTVSHEQRFRMGSENWTWSQRGYSYIAGILQSLILIFLAPVLWIPLIVAPIMVLSRVYLETIKSTGDAEYAVLVSAKLYARYIKYFFVFVFTAALFPWVMTFVS
jgi:hypothetical protein